MPPPWPLPAAVLQTDRTGEPDESADAPTGMSTSAIVSTSANGTPDLMSLFMFPMGTIDLPVVRSVGSWAILRMRDPWLCVPASRRVCLLRLPVVEKDIGAPLGRRQRI